MLRALLAACLVVVLAAPATAASSDARALAHLTNEDRAERGLRPLRWDDSIARKARRHSRRMADRDDLFHSRCLQCKFRDRSWTTLGENVGVGESSGSLQRAFMRSQHHRDNILCRCFRRFGVGSVRSNGRLWVTVIFYRG